MVAKLFFSYSHKDEDLRDELETHLAMLKRQGLVDAVHDRRITAGADLDAAVDGYLEEADVILCLVSPDSSRPTTATPARWSAPWSATARATPA